MTAGTPEARVTQCPRGRLLSQQSGTIMIASATVIVVVAAMAAAFFSSSHLAHKQSSTGIGRELAFLNAEIGLQAAMSEVQRQSDTASDGIGNCIGTTNGGSYSVTITPAWTGPGTYLLEATGEKGAFRRNLDAVIDFPETLYKYAAFGARSLGTNPASVIDSYDSSLGSYSSQQSFTDPAGNSIANSNGTSGGNGDLEISGVVNGNASPGPAGSIVWGGGGIVTGSTAPAASEVTLPPIDVGSAASTNDNGSLPLSIYDPITGALNVAAGSVTISAGTYYLSSFHVDSSASIITDGEVTIFVVGAFDLAGSMTTATADPSTLHVNCLADVAHLSGSPLTMQGGSTFEGAFYAPLAWLKTSGQAEIFGSVVVRDMELGGGSRCHFDERLSGLGTGVANLRILALFEE